MVIKVIFVAPKENIPAQLINKLKQYAKVYFYQDSPIDIRNINLLKEKGDKVLCPFPEPMAWKFPNEFIKDIPDLKAICLSTTSFDWIDGKLARKLNINLTNVPNPPNAVAEAAIFMMLALAKKWPLVFKENKFEFKPNNFIQEIKGKTMGIIGLGRIGSRIAELGVSMDMKVVYWSRKTRNNKYKYLKLNELLKTADFIFPCLVFNDKTKNFLSKKEINLVKPSASVVCNANINLLDKNYLLSKIKNKHIFGFAFESDNTNINDCSGNVFITKQINWYTKETLAKKMEIWIDNIIAVIKGKPINLVNKKDEK